MCGPPRLPGRPRKEEGAKERGRIGNNTAVLVHPLDDAKVQEEDEAHTFFPWSYYILASRFSHSTVTAKTTPHVLPFRRISSPQHPRLRCVRDPRAQARGSDTLLEIG